MCKRFHSEKALNIEGIIFLSENRNLLRLLDVNITNYRKSLINEVLAFKKNYLVRKCFINKGIYERVVYVILLLNS